MSDAFFFTQMEPLSVAVHAAANIGEIKVNDVRRLLATCCTPLTVHLQNVIVFGCGPVGLLLIATAKA